VRILVGLGNPGDKYSQTRHNIGFDIVDLLADRWSSLGSNSSFKKVRQSLEATGQWKDYRVALVKPQTFMNLSGEAVQQTLHFYKATPAELLVIHDDLDLELGRLKWAKGGSAGGHNGVSSIITCLSNREFTRLRVGIGRPVGTADNPEAKMDTADWVLSRFTKAQQADVEKIKNKAVEAIEYFLEQGLEATMNRFNSKG